jgi:threonine 3-dehydrogenase
MATRTILITGAGGEIGHSLSEALSGRADCEVVLLDVKVPQGSRTSISPKGVTQHWVEGDITDKAALDALFSRFDFTDIIHLAAILSTGGERDPLKAHLVNVEGSLNLLERARLQSEARRALGKKPTVFVFPSSIAAYGIGSPALKYQSGSVQEGQFLNPITMYGINKLYVEHLGRYYSTNFGSLAGDRGMLDFRSVRFPGLLSADTVPTGGTSDYGPEMIHAAAQGKPYKCFVSAKTSLPFMAMPDAVHCLLSLMDAPSERLTQRVYNVTSFTITAEEIRTLTTTAFPSAAIDFVIDAKRHAIVESWPVDMNDAAARRDWNWAPRFDKQATFFEYLIPRIRTRYQASKSGSASSSAHC